LLADSERVLIYHLDLEQITVKILDDTLGKTPTLLLTHDYQEIKKDYTIEELPALGKGLGTPI